MYMILCYDFVRATFKFLRRKMWIYDSHDFFIWPIGLLYMTLPPMICIATYDIYCFFLWPAFLWLLYDLPWLLYDGLYNAIWLLLELARERLRNINPMKLFVEVKSINTEFYDYKYAVLRCLDSNLKVFQKISTVVVYAITPLYMLSALPFDLYGCVLRHVLYDLYCYLLWHVHHCYIWCVSQLYMMCFHCYIWPAPIGYKF